MNNYNFNSCYKLGCNIKIQQQMDCWYKEKFGNDISIKRYDKSLEAQRVYGTDVVIILGNGKKLSIDEKVRRSSYLKSPMYALEIVSNAERDKLGWLYTNVADYIVYITLKDDNSLDIGYAFMFPIDFYFKEHIRDYVDEHKSDVKFVTTNNIYTTIIVLVHYTLIQRICGRNNCHQFGLVRYCDG